jgi:hypothetical protein
MSGGPDRGIACAAIAPADGISMSPRDLMLDTANAGDDWDDARKSELVARVVAGTLSIRQACDRHGLSPERIRDWVMVFRRSALQAFDDHLRETLVSQGLDADSLAAVAFNGTLDDIAISDLVQTMTMGRRDGMITVSHDGRQSRIWFAVGAIVDAESGRLRGEHALYRILALEQGRVVADFCPVRRSQAIQMPTMALLIDGARRKDECALLKQRLGDSLYRAAPEAAGANAMSSAWAALLRVFGVPRAVAEVVAESDLGDLETLRVISEWVSDSRLLPCGRASLDSIAPAARESFLIQASVLSVLPPPSATRVDRAPLSGRFRVGLAAALCGLGIAGGFLLPRLASPLQEEAAAPSLPSGDRLRAASSPRAVADEQPAASSDAGRLRRDEAPALPLAAERAEPIASVANARSDEPSERGVPASATSRAGNPSSRPRGSSAGPAPERASARADESAHPSTGSVASSPPGSAAVIEPPDQPRMRMIDEEETPSIRILE